MVETVLDSAVGTICKNVQGCHNKSKKLKFDAVKLCGKCGVKFLIKNLHPPHVLIIMC